MALLVFIPTRDLSRPCGHLHSLGPSTAFWISLSRMPVLASQYSRHALPAAWERCQPEQGFTMIQGMSPQAQRQTGRFLRADYKDTACPTLTETPALLPQVIYHPVP